MKCHQPSDCSPRCTNLTFRGIEHTQFHNWYQKPLVPLQEQQTCQQPKCTETQINWILKWFCNSKLPHAEKKLWQAQGTACHPIYSLNHKTNFSQLSLDWTVRNYLLKSELTKLLYEEKRSNRQALSWTNSAPKQSAVIVICNCSICSCVYRLGRNIYRHIYC